MVTRATILQVGDLHFPKFAGEASRVDVKDEFGTPADVAGEFATPLTVVIARALEDELRRSPEALVAVCGDLTDRGDLNGFARAVEFLSGALGVGVHIPAERVHVVPGNHDVDLNGEMKFVDLTPGRFSALQDRIDAASSPIQLTTDHRTTVHNFGAGGLWIHSVNTALANGAPRLLPTVGLTDPVSIAMEPTDSTRILTDAVALAAGVADATPQFALQESLDMPIFMPGVLQEMHRAGQNVGPGLFTVVAHHGFLPQATPRLGPYTEMINGGQVRRRFLQMDRPLLYLHGHIHEDAIEVVRGSAATPPLSPWPLIAIAAPRLVDGFNRIEVEYADDGRVLGILLCRIRVDRGTGGVTYSQPERLPIGSRKTIDPRHRRFFVEVVSAFGVSGADLIRMGAEATPEIGAEEVEQIVTEAVWAGVLESASDDRDPFVQREYVFR